MFLTTFWNLSLNYTTVETLNRANVTTIAMRGTRPDPSIAVRSPFIHVIYLSEVSFVITGTLQSGRVCRNPLACLELETPTIMARRLLIHWVIDHSDHN